MSDNQTTNVVLPSKLGGGPHGLGDPDDKSLRRVELEVMVPKIMRDKAKKEKCPEEVAAFTECCKDTSIFMVVKCRNENTQLKACLERWYQDEEFKNICKQEYLDIRSEYRRTGVLQKHKNLSGRLQ